MMGGQEAIRGFLYQAYAGVLTALSDTEWDSICIEPYTENDKIDIGLFKQEKMWHSIQVKSSTNLFTNTDIAKWLSDLIEDHSGVKIIELFLVGQLDTNANELVKAINNFQSDKTNNETEKALKKAEKSSTNFTRSQLKNKNFLFNIYANNHDGLLGMLNSLLHKYLTAEKIILGYCELELLINSLVAQQFCWATKHTIIKRSDFERQLLEQVKLLATCANPNERKIIEIKSFSRGAESPHTNIAYTLSLEKHFNGRYLKDDKSWNIDIYNTLKSTLPIQLVQHELYELHLNSHASIAFAVGRIFDSKMGINILPVQKHVDGKKFWSLSNRNNIVFQSLITNFKQINEEVFDVALAIGITHIIESDVITYIKQSGLPVGQLISCQVELPSNTSIVDGDHANELANSIVRQLKALPISDSRARLHIFVAAPNGFMFFLGKISRVFGRCTMYEYDLERRKTCSYTPSINFND